MTDDFDPETLAGLEHLPEDDPRVHALGPRARAYLRAHRDFVAPGDAPAGARVGEAERRLGEALEREIGVAAGAQARAGAPERRGFFETLLGPRYRPAVAVALVTVVAGAAWLYTMSQRGGEAPVAPGPATPSAPGAATPAAPRGEAPTTGGTQTPATPAPSAGTPIMRGGQPAPQPGELVAGARVLPGGTIRLEWTASPEAETYTLVFLSPDLAEVARVPGLGETRFDLRTDSLPAGLAPGSHVLWRVVAMRGGDPVARSKTAAVRVP